MHSLGRFLRALREEVGVTQVELGARLDLQQTSISAIEGGRQSVSAAQLSRWLAVCGATDEQRVEATRLAAPGDAGVVA